MAESGTEVNPGSPNDNMKICRPIIASLRYRCGVHGRRDAGGFFVP